MNSSAIRLKNSIKSFVVTVVAVLTLAACSDTPEQKLIDGKTMGTTYHVKYIVEENIPEQKELKAKIDSLLFEVNDQMSTYKKTSELSRFNQQESLKPFNVSAETIIVVKEAMRLHDLTRGALDITVGPLVNLWGFGPEARPDVVPTDEELAARRERVGLHHLKVTDTRLVKGIPDLYVDLSTIAKGWGVDVIANHLDNQGIQNYMVEIGGEVRLKGQNREGMKWRIAIEKPVDSTQSVQLIIQPGDMAMATSGNYRNYFEQDGIRYSHIIDPKTGKPIANRVVSVTALHPSTMTADGLATGLMVLGEEVGIEVANQHELAVMMIVKTDNGFSEVYSDAFKPYLTPAPQQ